MTRGLRTKTSELAPRALSSRRIFRERALDACLVAGVLLAGCSTSGLELEDDVDVAQEEDRSPAQRDQRDGGWARRDAGHDREPHSMRDGGRDARVLLDARMADDAASRDASILGEPLTCGPGAFPVHAARLLPLQGYDYVAVREAGEQAGLDAGVETWTSTDFRTLSQAGTSCARAVGSACREQVAHHPSKLANRICTDHCFEHAVVTTRGDEVRRWATPAELRTLFGPIDSADEALMLVAAADYSLACDDATLSALRTLADGYEVHAIRSRSPCPVRAELVGLHVAVDGALSVLSTRVLPPSGGVCVAEP